MAHSSRAADATAADTCAMEVPNPAVPVTPKRPLLSTPSGSTPATPASKGSSSKKVKRMRPATGPANKLVPGVRETTKSFTRKIWEKEGLTAAYLGYSRLDDFRRFVISPVILESVARITNQDRTKSSMQEVLELIRDEPHDMDSEEDPTVKYPVEHTGSLNCRAALYVVQTYKAIQKSQFENVAFTEAQISAALDKIENVLGQKFPRISSGQTLVYPKFGHFANLGECDLERYARVYTLIRHVGHAAGKDVFGGRYGSDDWAVDTSIGNTHVPQWMAPKVPSSAPLAPDAPIFGPIVSNTERPALSLPINWVFKSNLEAPKAYREYIEGEEPELESLLPKQSQTIKIEPESTREHFLDSVRITYKMDVIKANIYEVSLKLVSTEESEEDQRFSITTDDWSTVKQALWESTWNTSKSAFTLLVRQADDGEIIWQSDVPLVVQQVMGLSGGDVVALQPEEDSTAPKTEASDSDEGIVHTLRDSNKQRLTLDPNALFEGRRDAMLKFYEGHDTTTPEGLLAWQRATVQRLTRTDQHKIVGDSAKKKLGSINIDKAEEAILSQARKDGEHRVFALDEASRRDKAANEHYYNLAQIRTGTSGQVGLPLRPCAKALELEPFRDERKRLMYRGTGKTFGQKAFFPWQVTGACTAIVGAFGYMPVRDDAPGDVKEAAASLKGLAIAGKMICDQTGLGKSMLLLMNLHLARSVQEFDGDGNPIYRMMALVVPAGVIKQWVDDILDDWPELTLMISYDDTGLSGARYQSHFISASALRYWPDSTKWPAQFRYIFDPKDPKIASTILLTSNETHVSRSLKYKWVNYGMDDNGEPITIKTAYSVLKGVIGRAAVDEGHKMKDEKSRRWQAQAGMYAPINWILGATPMSNVSSDFVAQLKLIWKGTKLLLKQDAEALKWVEERRGSMRMFQEGEYINEPLDKRRLGFLHPGTVRYLLEKGTKVEIARYFHLCEDILCVKRFMGSQLPMDFDSDEVFDMKDSMEPYFIKTLYCDFRPDEQPAHQFLHREASRRFLVASRNNQIAMKAMNSIGAGGKNSILYPVAEMRELLITAMSTKLRLFHEICKKMRRDTLVDTLNEYRGQSFDGFRFVRFMCTKLKLALPTTAYGYLEFLCDGSPMLRNLIWSFGTGDKFLKPRREGKFLVAEDVPLNAMFLEWGLNMFGLETAVFHSGLTQGERNELQKDFNNEKQSLDGMIIMYDVGGFGLNFWQDCHLAYMCTPAKNESAEIQTGGRVIRAPQKLKVEITKLFVNNSIFAYREHRKRDKYLPELATRAHDPVMKALIVKCLNDFQKTVLAAQQDPANREMMEVLEQQAEIDVEKERLVIAGVVRDPLDLVAIDAPTSKRVSKRPKLFSEAKFVKGKPLYPGDEGYTDAEDDDNHDGARRSSRIQRLKISRRKQDAQGAVDATEDESEDDSIHERVKPRFLQKDPLDDDFVDEGSDHGEDSDEDYDSGDDKVAPRWIDSDDEDGGSDIDREEKTPTAAEKRKEKKAAYEAFHREEQEDEGVRQLRLLLTADPSRVYTIKDLENEATLTRGLEIVYCLRVGQRPDKVPSIHIKYDAIHHALDDEIKAQVKVDESSTLLKDILTAQNVHAPDQVLQTPTARLPAVTTPSPVDDGNVELDYTKMKATELRSLLSKRHVPLKGASTKEAFIRLLKEDDLRKRLNTQRTTTEKEKADLIAWAKLEFASGDAASSLRVPNYEDMQDQDLRARCAKFGYINPGCNHQQLVAAIHAQNMRACSLLEYDEVPSKYLARMVKERCLGSEAKSAGPDENEDENEDALDRDDLVRQLRADDVDRADLNHWERKYVTIDLTKPWVN